MTNVNSNNKRIAKNTVILYLRLLATMAVSLYAARVVLDVLGVSDYGVYNVTGSVISMFTFVSSTMATATQRYLSFELGKGSDQNVKKVFMQSLYSYLFILFVVLFIGETIGLWILNNILVIPANRMFAANIVYQFSILTFMCSVIHAPLNASIIAMERMSVFAYGTIFLSFLNLFAVLVLDYFRFSDALIAYAILVFLANLFVTIFYWYYCVTNFDFCSLRLGKMDKTLISQMTSFAFWNVIGTITNILRNHGVNILLNVFFSPTINTARAIALKISTILTQFSSNFYMAVRPQLVKLYSIGQKEKMFELGFQSSRFAFFLLLILVVPIFCEVDKLLGIWLTQVPDYTVLFVRIILLMSLMEVLGVPLDHMMQASGCLKEYQISVCSVNILNIPLSYIVLKFGFGPEFTMYINALLFIASFIPRLIKSKKIINMPICAYLKSVVLRLLPPSFVVSIWIVLSGKMEIIKDTNVFIALVIHFLFVVFIVGCLGLSYKEKNMILKAIVEKIILKKIER